MAVMKKWGEMRFATINSGTNQKLIPMTFWVGGNKLLELTAGGQGKPVFQRLPGDDDGSDPWAADLVRGAGTRTVYKYRFCSQQRRA